MKLFNSKQEIVKVVDLLTAEKVVALPTETVYGLAGRADSSKAIEEIYRIKSRPAINPLISHYASIDEIAKDVELNDLARKLLEKFSPGPLTLVLPRKKDSRISELACAGLKTAAVRIPNHELTLEILQELKLPLVAPSANPSGRLSPISAENVAKMFEDKLDYIFDGGHCTVGLESTVVEVLDGQVSILRYGAITVENILELVDEVKIPEREETIKSPGMLLKHYSPICPIRLSIEEPKEDEALLAFGDTSNIDLSQFTQMRNLSKRANLEEAASNLFKMIHELEEMNIKGIAVMEIPSLGIGKAINDRLKRAASAENTNKI